MIINKTQYTDEHKKEIEKYYKEIEVEADYVGEDGNMACNAKTKMGALKMFRKRVEGDCGQEEADVIKISDIGIGYLFLTDKNNKDHEYMISEGSEWYVNWSGEMSSDYKVYVYMT